MQIQDIISATEAHESGPRPRNVMVHTPMTREELEARVTNRSDQTETEVQFVILIDPFDYDSESMWDHLSDLAGTIVSAWHLTPIGVYQENVVYLVDCVVDLD
jgi:hypothetical protein